jgi:6-phosphogluconolactonase
MIAVPPRFAAPADCAFVYVSAHADGDICAYAMAVDSGCLEPVARVPAAKLVMSMAPSPDGRFLYAVVRSQPYSVFVYGIDWATGRLARIGTSPLPESMVYAAVDRSGRWLLTAGYGSNTLCVHAIDGDGGLADAPTHVLPSGGVKPHAIRFDGANRFVYVPHLGTDEVRIYEFDAGTGRLASARPAAVKVSPGTGPRHFVLSTDDRFLYLLGQLTGVVTVFARDAATGGLEAIQTIGSVPSTSGLKPGRPRPPTGSAEQLPPETTSIWCADIQMTPDGRFLFASERARSTVTILAADRESGVLRFVDCISTEKQPRGIAVDPNGRHLVVSGETSSNLAVYVIDTATGALTLRQKVPVGTGANWVQFVAAAV